ncbi:unnamed protein product [Prunus brigantina]
MMRLFGVWTSNQTIVAERGTYLGRKHVKVLKVRYRKNKLLRGRLLVFGVGPFERGLDLSIYRRGPGEPIEAEKDLPDGLKISAWWSLIGASG